MHLVKVFAIGAAIAYGTDWLSQQSFMQSNATLSKYGPYIAGGAVLVAVKHFNLV